VHERLARCAARGMGQRARSARLQARSGPGQAGVQGEVVQPRVLVGSSRAAESQGESEPRVFFFQLYRFTVDRRSTHATCHGVTCS